MFSSLAIRREDITFRRLLELYSLPLRENNGRPDSLKTYKIRRKNRNKWNIGLVILVSTPIWTFLSMLVFFFIYLKQKCSPKANQSKLQEMVAISTTEDICKTKIVLNISYVTCYYIMNFKSIWLLSSTFW